MKSKKLWIGIVVVVLMVGCVGVAISKKPKTQDTIGGFKNGPRVQIEMVKKDDIETKISASGKLEAKDTQTIYAQQANKIIIIHRKTGDIVKKGDVLLTLDKDTEQITQKQLEALAVKLNAEQDALNRLLVGGTKKDILSTQSTIVQNEKSIQDAKDQLEIQQTNLENAKRDLKNKKTEYEVQEELFQEGLASQKEIDDAKIALTDLQQKIESTETAISSAKKSIEAASLQKETSEYSLGILLNQIQDPDKKQNISAKQAQIKDIQNQIFTAKKDLEKAGTEIIAPIDGVIIKIPAQGEEGMPITAGQELIKIVNPSKLIINCDVSPYYAADLKVGLKSKIKYTGSKTVEVDGEITKVSPVAIIKQSTTEKTTATANIPVEIEVANPGTIIKPGFSVDVKIITETRKGVCIIPLLATIEDDDNSTYVYVVKEDGTLEKRTVTQGLNNGLYVEADNLKENEIVVANPTEFLKAGTKVSYEKTGDVK